MGKNEKFSDSIRNEESQSTDTWSEWNYNNWQKEKVIIN